jgi:hypothetical protein
MFHKKPFLIIVLFFFAFVSFGQRAPGYQGKKLFIEYNLNINMLMLANSETSFGPTHDFQLSYVLFRKGQIGLTYDIYDPRVKDEEDQFTGKAIGINYTMYSKNSLAPVGTFWRFEYKQLMNKSVNGEQFKAAYLGFGLGVSRVFYKRLILKVGLDFGIVMKYLDPDDTLAFEYDLLQRMYLMRSHVGLGVLLF